jgi:tRNA pseudouridine65 synthase
MQFDLVNLPLGPEVRIIKYDPCGVIALSKPTGVLSHPNAPKDKSNSLLTTTYDLGEQCYITSLPECKKVYLLHRLDSATSGVILIATNSKIADYARAAIKDQKMNKVYHAWVKGRPRSTPGSVWTDRLSKEHSASGQLKMRAGTSIIAKTKFKVLQTLPPPQNISLVELTPLTGRTHQLRIQCALHDVPILGDKTYGDFALNRKLKAPRLMLHAYSVQLPLPRGKVFEAVCEGVF